MHYPKERRKYRRFKVALPIDCSGIHFFQTRNSRNLSHGGIFIATKLIEKLGTKIEIAFVFKEDWEIIKIIGEVVWTGQSAGSEENGAACSGMGIKFIDPPAEFSRRIQKICPE